MRPHEIDGKRRLIRVGGILAVVILIGGYALYAAIPLILGPSLTLSADQQENGLVRVYGTASRVSYLSLNGLEVPLDEAGYFEALRAYPAGYTVLQAKAIDRFGRAITKELTFVTEEYGEVSKEAR